MKEISDVDVPDSDPDGVRCVCHGSGGSVDGPWRRNHPGSDAGADFPHPHTLCRGGVADRRDRNLIRSSGRLPQRGLHEPACGHVSPADVHRGWHCGRVHAGACPGPGAHDGIWPGVALFRLSVLSPEGRSRGGPPFRLVLRCACIWRAATPPPEAGSPTRCTV